MCVTCEDDHLRSEGDKTAFDGHLHWIAFDDAKHEPEWHVTVEIREFRRSVTVVAIVPSSSGSDGLHPKAERTLLADLPDESVLTCSWVSVDNEDFRPPEFVRGILRGGLELRDESDPARMFEELLWELPCELDERSLSEALKERLEISPFYKLASREIIPSEYSLYLLLARPLLLVAVPIVWLRTHDAMIRLACPRSSNPMLARD